MLEHGRGTRPASADSSRPFVILDSGDGLAAESARLLARGWQVAEGFAARPAAPAVVLAGYVSGAADAEAALLAALDGYGLLIAAGTDHAVLDRLADDLRRLGPVEHRQPGGAEATASSDTRLDPHAAAILGLLAEGHSLGEAAAILGLSRRTADRRLAEARRALGTERTTEAIARATRLGWLRR